MDNKKEELIAELIASKFEGGRGTDVACKGEGPICSVMGCENHCAWCDCCTCGCTGGCECG
jgi:hypothetical protein